MVKIKKQLVSSRSKSYSGTNGRKYITIHETANKSKGANAQAHANLQTNGFSSSWHWTVDDKEAIQSFPHKVRCWHAGDGQGNGNLNSIGIEICVNSDGNFKQAVKNAAELTKKIMKDENIPISNVVQHNHWSGKNCPTNLRNGSKGINWSDFKSMLGGSFTTSKSQKPATSTVKYTPKPAKSKPKKTKDKTQSGAVAQVQNALNKEYGYKLSTDNLYGPQTKRALIRAYQTELNRQYNAGLVVDGIWGPKTHDASVNVRKGARGKITWLLQAMLVIHGYNIAVDGIYGNATEKALRSFQRANKLTVDAIAGKATFAKLFA